LFTCFVYARFFYQAINVLSGMFFYSYLGGMWKNLPIKYYIKAKLIDEKKPRYTGLGMQAHKK
jgi:hypothetical protein